MQSSIANELYALKDTKQQQRNEQLYEKYRYCTEDIPPWHLHLQAVISCVLHALEFEGVVTHLRICFCIANNSDNKYRRCMITNH